MAQVFAQLLDPLDSHPQAQVFSDPFRLVEEKEIRIVEINLPT